MGTFMSSKTQQKGLKNMVSFDRVPEVPIRGLEGDGVRRLGKA